MEEAAVRHGKAGKGSSESRRHVLAWFWKVRCFRCWVEWESAWGWLAPTELPGSVTMSLGAPDLSSLLPPLCFEDIGVVCSFNLVLLFISPAAASSAWLGDLAENIKDGRFLDRSPLSNPSSQFNAFPTPHLPIRNMKAVLSLLALVASASAHTIFSEVYVNGVGQGFKNALRLPDYNGPIENPQAAAMTCNGMSLNR